MQRMEPTPHLSYSPRAPLSATLSRRSVTIAIVLALTAFLAMVGPIFISSLANIFWETKAATYLPPADQLALQYDAANGTYIVPPLPSCWRHLDLGAGRQGLILLHRMQCDNNDPVLVAVSVSGGTSALGGTGIMLITSVQSREHRPVPFNTQWRALEWAAGASRVTIQVAKPDPADPSHFTFTGEADGIRHDMDGWLRADQSLLISERDTRQ